MPWNVCKKNHGKDNTSKHWSMDVSCNFVLKIWTSVRLGQMIVMELHCVTTHMVASAAIVCQGSVTMAQIAGVSLYTQQKNKNMHLPMSRNILPMGRGGDLPTSRTFDVWFLPLLCVQEGTFCHCRAWLLEDKLCFSDICLLVKIKTSQDCVDCIAPDALLFFRF